MKFSRILSLVLALVFLVSCGEADTLSKKVSSKKQTTDDFFEGVIDEIPEETVLSSKVSSTTITSRNM